jgi:uncharacterized protein YbjT (DUF2867 family)
MNVLLTGQGGFIGTRLRARLLARGHVVPPLRLDFREAVESGVWQPHLGGVDAVINAAGIFTEARANDFELINHLAPCALFRAAAGAGVGLIIQFSALGADRSAASRFHLSKRAADECLRSLPVPSVCLQPSLVFGPGGGSAQLMIALASAPLIPLPGSGNQMIQPIHVDDLIDAVVLVLESSHAGHRTIALVGPRAVNLRGYLGELRAGMEMSPGWFTPVPLPAARLAARIGARVTAAPLDPEALDMLERGNVADPADTQALLGRAPRDPGSFISPAHATDLRSQAVLSWLLPILRGSIALMWIWAAVVSLWFHPLADSYGMLAAVGIPAGLAPLALYGAAACDLILGVLTLLMRRRRRLWQVQILLVLVYTIIITIRLPAQLTHPFGPIVKNLPILVALWMLAELEPGRRQAR